LDGISRRSHGEKIIGVMGQSVLRPEMTGGPSLRARSLRGNGVEMTERQCKLHGEQHQHKPRAMSDVRPDPLHAEKRLAPESLDILALPKATYNITALAEECQP